MSHTTQILPFGLGAGANVEDPALWASAPERSTGFQAGIASSQKFNTAFRQAAFVAGMIAKFTADYGPADVMDNGDLTSFENDFVAALTAALLSVTGAIHVGVDTGTANAMVVTSFTPTLTALAAGNTFLIKKSAAANTGAVTLDITVDGTTKSMLWPDGTALAAGHWPANAEGLVFFDGTNYRLMTIAGPSIFAQALYKGNDTGSANHLVVNTVPALPSYTDYAIVETKVAHDNTGATDINVSSLGVVSISRADGTALQAGDLSANVIQLLIYNSSLPGFNIMGFGRSEVPRIIPNPVLYVRTDGSDAHDGSVNDAGHAFRTVTGALTWAIAHLVLSGQILTIQLGLTGTYDLPQVINGSGRITISGDQSAPGSYTLSGTAPAAGLGSICQVVSGSITFDGLTLLNNSSIYSTVLSQLGGQITLTYSHFTSGTTNSAPHVLSGPGGSINIGTGVSFAGNMGASVYAEGGAIGVGPVVVTYVGTPTYSVATMVSSTMGQLFFVAGASFSGSVTGTRYIANLNSIISTQNGTPTTFIPGTVGGTVDASSLIV